MTAAETERLFEATFEHAGVGMCHSALDGTFVRVNKRFCEIAGWPEEELLGRRFDDITHPEDLKRDRASAARVLAGEVTSYTVDKRYITKGGSTVWVQLDVTLLLKGDGRPDRYLGTVVDITPRVRAEEDSRVREERLRRAEILGRTGFYEFNADGTDPVWSDGMRAIWGIQPGATPPFGELVGWLHPDDVGPIMADVAEATAALRGFDFEYRICRPDGGIVTVHSVAEIMVPPNGSPPRFFGTMANVTDQKQLEAELTSSLREKDTLLQEIHHRVKNNLQILSSLLYLQMQRSDEGGKRMLEQLRQRVLSMTLVHEKLYGRQNLSSVDFKSYLEDLGRQLAQSSLARDAEIDFTVEAAAAALPIGIAIPLGLVTTELFTNALKHAFVGRTCGSIALTTVLDDGVLRLTVQDDGVGMRDGGGVGSFGWQLVRNLTAQINGAVSVENEVGTRITVRVPLQVQ